MAGRTGDGEGSADRKHQAQNAAVQLPQPVLHAVLSQKLPPTRRSRRTPVVVGEDPVDYQGVESDYQGRGQDGDDAEVEDGNALLDGILVLQGVVP